MNYPYCLPIIKTAKDDVLQTIRQHKNDYTFFEVWLEYIDELDTTFLERLEDELKERLVVVFRRQQLAPMQLPLEQRYQLLNTLNDTSALVDLDITTQQSEIDYIQQQGFQLNTIISYHNYQQTPPKEELESILQQVRKNNPSILKIATECQNENNALSLLDLLLSVRESGQKFIILGMGDKGLITRIFGALWGNALIFAPETADEQSAPGQLTRKQLDNILQTIGE